MSIYPKHRPARCAGRVTQTVKSGRPAHYLYLKVMVYTPDNNAHAGTVQTEPDGAMYAYSPTAGDAQKYTSLAGVSFPLGS